MLNKVAPLLAVLTVAGCMNGSEITTAPVKPTYKASAKNLTANATYETQIRTHKKVDGKKVELSGVPCKIDTPYYSVNVVTPAKMNLPSLAEKTPPLTATCTYEGKVYAETVGPINDTVQKRTTNLGGGLLVYAIVAGTTKDEISAFRYPYFSVDLSE